MKLVDDAQKLKQERERNTRIIQMQKEQELMKNNNVKDMIRQQKNMAEERKEMVNNIQNFFKSNLLIYFTIEMNLIFCDDYIGRTREEASIKKPSDQQHFRRKQQKDGN